MANPIGRAFVNVATRKARGLPGWDSESTLDAAVVMQAASRIGTGKDVIR